MKLLLRDLLKDMEMILQNFTKYHTWRKIGGGGIRIEDVCTRSQT